MNDNSINNGEKEVKPLQPDNKEVPPNKQTIVKPKEIGGPPGPEPTQYGDWQFKGRVSDF